MAGIFPAFLFAYLLSVSFTDSVQVNVSSVSKLVDYSYDFGFDSLLPSVSYNGTIFARWAVPDSALRGFEGRSVTIRVRANAENSSTIFFPSALGFQSKTYDSYLRCDVFEGKCANSSALLTGIPIMASARLSSQALENITLVSEVAEGLPVSGLEGSANNIFDSITSIWQNSSGQKNESHLPALPNESGNFLDSLKPEGDSNDPVLFLRENPLISIAALAVVIVITGAYLLNSKD